jgi:hypothetical protein
MKTFLGGALVVLLAVAAPSAASGGELTLTMSGGRVTLIAQDVPLRDILREWARIGKTTIVNGDKLAGPPLTLQLVDQPEREVLDLLLRAASGYVVAPRPVLVADASAFDRILIMPTSRPPAATFSQTPAPFNNRAMPQPQPQPDFDDPVEPVNQAVPGMNPANPNADPNAPPPTQAAPGMPTGAQTPMTAPRPGMLPQPPPGQPNPYGPQPQPQPLPPGVRPPGGGGGEGQIQ